MSNENPACQDNCCFYLNSSNQTWRQPGFWPEWTPNICVALKQNFRLSVVQPTVSIPDTNDQEIPAFCQIQNK